MAVGFLPRSGHLEWCKITETKDVLLLRVVCLLSLLPSLFLPCIPSGNSTNFSYLQMEKGWPEISDIATERFIWETLLFQLVGSSLVILIKMEKTGSGLRVVHNLCNNY